MDRRAGGQTGRWTDGQKYGWKDGQEASDRVRDGVRSGRCSLFRDSDMESRNRFGHDRDRVKHDNK